MDIYLIPSKKRYEIVGKLKIEEKIEKKGLKNKVKYYLKKLTSSQEKLLQELKNAEEIKIHFPSSINEKEAKKICNDLIKRKKVKYSVYLTIDSIMAPTTFVSAPFLPIVNWGFTAFFVYKLKIHLNDIRGLKKLKEQSSYAKKEELSEFEKILLDEGYKGCVKKAEELGIEEIVEFYKKKQKKEENLENLLKVFYYRYCRKI